MEGDEKGTLRSENPGAVVSGALSWLEPLRSVYTDALEVASYEAGPSEGDVVLLLHGFSYDIHSYVDVIPRLVEAGHRVIAPCLRGYGPTRFLDSAATRSGQQAAINSDTIALLDASSLYWLHRLSFRKNGLGRERELLSNRLSVNECLT